MTKAQFDDIVKCAKAWGIATKLRILPIDEVRYRVLRAAGTKDAEEYAPMATTSDLI